MPTGANTSAGEARQMVAAYKSGMTCQQAAALVGLSAGACKLALRRLGVVPRNRVQAAQKYEIDHDFFRSIDTAEKAYWLGFIAADGCVYDNRITLTLGIRDRDHALRWARTISPDLPVRYIRPGRKGGATVSVSFKSTIMANDLARWGIKSRKTFALSPPILDRESAKHYWRGMIDGDGGIRKNRQGLYLCGTREVVDGFLLFAKSVTKTTASAWRQSSIFATEIGGDHARRVITVLYRGAKVALPRKNALAKKIIDHPSLMEK